MEPAHLHRQRQLAPQDPEAVTALVRQAIVRQTDLLN